MPSISGMSSTTPGASSSLRARTRRPSAQLDQEAAFRPPGGVHHFHRAKLDRVIGRKLLARDPQQVRRRRSVPGQETVRRVRPAVAWPPGVTDEHAPPAAAEHEGGAEPGRATPDHDAIVVRRQGAQAGAGGGGRVTCLHHLLQAAEVVGDLLVRGRAEQVGHGFPDLTGGGRVARDDADLGAATARGDEQHRPCLVHFGPRQRAPGDQLVLNFVVDLGVPLDACSERPLCHPAGATPVQQRDRFEVVHEARQVLELPPEPEQLFVAPMDDDRLLNRACLGLDDAACGTHRRVVRSRVPAQDLVDLAATGQRPPQEHDAQREQDRPEPPAPEAECKEGRARGAGDPPLGAADIRSPAGSDPGECEAAHRSGSSARGSLLTVASSSVRSRPKSSFIRTRGSAPKNSVMARPARPAGGL